MNWLSQVVTITGVTLRSLGQRLGSSIVAIIGIAGVVIVFIAVLSIAEGFRAAMTEAGDPRDRDRDAGRQRHRDDQHYLAATKRGHHRERAGGQGRTGRSIASAELFVIVNHPMRRSGTDANVPLRGCLRPCCRCGGSKMVEGRMFELGRNEIIVGRAASRQFVGLDVGTDVRWGENTWRSSGSSRPAAAASESELWCDVKVLQPAYRRGNSYNSMYVKLDVRRRVPAAQGRADDGPTAAT